MKYLYLVAALIVVCVMLTCATMLAPVMHAVSLSYLTLSLCVVIGLLCVVGLFSCRNG